MGLNKFSVKYMSKVKQHCSLFLYSPGFSGTKGTLPCNTLAGRNILASVREWLGPFLCHPTWGHWVNLPQPVPSMRKLLHHLATIYRQIVRDDGRRICTVFPPFLTADLPKISCFCSQFWSCSHPGNIAVRWPILLPTNIAWKITYPLSKNPYYIRNLSIKVDWLKQRGLQVPVTLWNFTSRELKSSVN